MTKILKDLELKEKVYHFVYDKEIARKIVEANSFLDFEYMDCMVRPVNYTLKYLPSGVEYPIRELGYIPLYVFMRSNEGDLVVDGLSNSEVKTLLDIEEYWQKMIYEAIKDYKEKMSLGEYRTDGEDWHYLEEEEYESLTKENNN
jgi:hypothetical protein